VMELKPCPFCGRTMWIIHNCYGELLLCICRTAGAVGPIPYSSSARFTSEQRACLMAKTAATICESVDLREAGGRAAAEAPGLKRWLPGGEPTPMRMEALPPVIGTGSPRLSSPSGKRAELQS
jgi:hypothetical protein